jgi:hypothetical protein
VVCLSVLPLILILPLSAVDKSDDMVKSGREDCLDPRLLVLCGLLLLLLVLLLVVLLLLVLLLVLVTIFVALAMANMDG